MAQLQTYATHTHRPRLAGAAGLFAGVALGLFAIDAFRRPDRLTIGLICLTVAVMCLVAISRLYIVRLQDRIILLEMRMRLMRLGREADYGRLSKRQLISPRFASDAELPALAQRAMTESLTGTQIKRAIRDWQADYHRT
jgi:Family of unknown function (DUF6526)